ncbi:MAG TPA: hypothetical protein VEF92_00910 [Burkholderiales bacterium]|nr:hypothetical protein [Burkholderiales bacterium]
MEQPIAWLMTIAAAAGMTAYADGLEKRGETPPAAQAQPSQAQTPVPQNLQGTGTLDRGD